MGVFHELCELIPASPALRVISNVCHFKAEEWILSYSISEAFVLIGQRASHWRQPSRSGSGRDPSYCHHLL